MPWKTPLLLALALVFSACGGRSDAPPPASTAVFRPIAVTTAAATIERTSYRGWPEAYRLSNGTVEVVVVPAVGRIMRYALVGGDNLLWEDARLAGQAPKAAEWVNFGGDKIWPWPQARWGTLSGSGSDWPPPLSPAPYAAEISTGALRLASPPISAFGCAFIQTIRLEPTGTRLSIETRFIALGGVEPQPVAAWEIAQLAPPELLLARLVPGGKLADGYKVYKGLPPWPGIRHLGSDVLAVERKPATTTKIGMDADALAWAKDGILFMAKAEALNPGVHESGDRAQLFALSGEGAGAYVELELTSPISTPSTTSGPGLKVTWEVRKLAAEERNEGAWAEALRKF